MTQLKYKPTRSRCLLHNAYILMGLCMCLLLVSCSTRQDEASPAAAGEGLTTAQPPAHTAPPSGSLPGSPVQSADLPAAETPPAAPLPTLAPSAAAPVPPPVAPPSASPAAAPYTLDILGTSEKLNKAAWQRMLQWRSNIKQYVRKHPSVVLNGPDRKAVALTFDDGPDSETMPQVLKILKDKGVTASFFFVGSRVAQQPELVKQAYDEGHLVLNHSYTHAELPKLSSGQLREELDKTDEAIERIIGRRPVLLRPPYGETNAAVEQAWSGEDRKLVLWSLDTLDWSLKESKPIEKNVADYVRNGEIILMHTTEETGETAAALPAIIDGLLEKGFRIVGLDELLDTPAYSQPIE